jgi:hypothetical protein
MAAGGNHDFLERFLARFLGEHGEQLGEGLSPGIAWEKWEEWLGMVWCDGARVTRCRSSVHHQLAASTPAAHTVAGLAPNFAHIGGAPVLVGPTDFVGMG